MVWAYCCIIGRLRVRRVVTISWQSRRTYEVSTWLSSDRGAGPLPGMAPSAAAKSALTTGWTTSSRSLSMAAHSRSWRTSWGRLAVRWSMASFQLRHNSGLRCMFSIRNTSRRVMVLRGVGFQSSSSRVRRLSATSCWSTYLSIHSRSNGSRPSRWFWTSRTSTIG